MIILGVASGIEGNIGSGRLSFVLRQGLAMQLRLASISWQFCLSLLNARITGIYYHTW